MGEGINNKIKILLAYNGYTEEEIEKYIKRKNIKEYGFSIIVSCITCLISYFFFGDKIEHFFFYYLIFIILGIFLTILDLIYFDSNLQKVVDMCKENGIVINEIIYSTNSISTDDKGNHQITKSYTINKYSPDKKYEDLRIKKESKEENKEENNVD